MRLPRAALASAVLVGLTAVATPAHAAAPAPLLHYAFDADDLATGTVTDSSGNGLDGTLVNGATASLVDAPDGNANTLTFTVEAPRSGTYAMRVRYSNPEQSAATHYNPDPLARHADIAVNGGTARRVLFPHTFHDNNFWELTVPVTLTRGANRIRFSAAELPNFDGVTYASETFPGILLRSQYAPVIDRITVAPFSAPVPR